MKISSLIPSARDVSIPAPLADAEVTGICFDSRQASPGVLFFALAGRNADGAAFAHDAVSKGAVAVVADASSRISEAADVIRVPDARESLAVAAARICGLEAIQCDRDALPVIGVTGTNGKTTTSYMLRTILAEADRPAALLGTIECDLAGRRIPSQLTTPDPVSLAQYLVEAHGRGARAAVMEVSSHSLDQRRADGIRFRAAVFTNLTQDHLDYHPSFDQYLAAKRRLFERLDNDAIAAVNADDPAAERMLEGCRARIVRYGITGDSVDLRGRPLREDRQGCAFAVEYAGRRMEMQTPMVGRHNVYNALAALAASLALNVDLSVAARGIARLDGVPGRLFRVPTGDAGYDVFIDYAHTDDALRNVLTAVRPLTTGRLWCLFGCGGDRDRTKRPLMARAVAKLADHFVITSDNPRTEDPLSIIQDIERGLGADDAARKMTIPDRRRAIFHAVEQLRPGDTLIIAGKGHEDYQIIGREKIHFDDAEVAARAVARREGRIDATAHVA